MAEKKIYRLKYMMSQDKSKPIAIPKLARSITRSYSNFILESDSFESDLETHCGDTPPNSPPQLLRSFAFTTKSEPDLMKKKT